VKYYILALLMAFGIYQWYSSTSEAPRGFTGESHDTLIMYSLTTCGYCKQKGRALEIAGIPYVEYFIDKDEKKNDELKKKLFSSGYSPKGYDFPVFDAYGYMLLNNPSVSEILSVRVGAYKYITMHHTAPSEPRPSQT
jgi:hypothetical protein